MDPNRTNTYTINSTNTRNTRDKKKENNSHFQKMDSVKSKILENQGCKKKSQRYSSNGSIHDINSASSADEWIDLDEDELEPENTNQNDKNELTTAAVKSNINPHHLPRAQNFIR